MKLSTKILVFIFILMIAGLLSSNIILKKQYDAIDKSDVYWTYNKILEKPFKYLNIIGGNGTNIFYEQSDKSSVRILQEWVNYHNGEIKATIKNDTLFLNFDYVPGNSFEKYWLENAAPVRIFSPGLLFVTGNNTNFEMHKVKQTSIIVRMSGKSKFEVESMFPELDSINVYQSDSSAVTFEMSPDYRNTTTQNNFTESMSINSVTANINDYSILDVGHAQIKKLHVHVSDSSAIVLSGNALEKINDTSFKK